MIEDITKEFFNEVSRQFTFLDELGFTKSSASIDNPCYFPDKEAIVKYVGSTIGIGIYWSYASAVIGIYFFELDDGKQPEKIYFGSEYPGAKKAIKLYSLADYYNQINCEYFLLSYPNNVMLSKINERAKIIDKNLAGVIAGLIRAMNDLASKIIKGDASIFDAIISYEVERRPTPFTYKLPSNG